MTKDIPDGRLPDEIVNAIAGKSIWMHAVIRLSSVIGGKARCI